MFTCTACGNQAIPYDGTDKHNLECNVVVQKQARKKAISELEPKLEKIIRATFKKYDVKFKKINVNLDID